jgi:hypothetical protein
MDFQRHNHLQHRPSVQRLLQTCAHLVQLQLLGSPTWFRRQAIQAPMTTPLLAVLLATTEDWLIFLIQWRWLDHQIVKTYASIADSFLFVFWLCSLILFVCSLFYDCLLFELFFFPVSFVSLGVVCFHCIDWLLCVASFGEISTLFVDLVVLSYLILCFFLWLLITRVNFFSCFFSCWLFPWGLALSHD